MDPLNQHNKPGNPAVVGHNLENRREIPPKVNTNDAPIQTEQHQSRTTTSVLLPFAAVTAKMSRNNADLYVVRTAPDTCVTHPPPSKSKPADGQPHTTQQFTRDHNNNISQSTQKPASVQLSLDMTTTTTTAAAVVPLAQQQQQPVARNYVHPSPYLTSQSYYSGKLITDSYSSEPTTSKTTTFPNSAETSASSSSTTVTTEQHTVSTSSSQAAATTNSAAEVPSMDTALSSIFSSTEFFAGWIGGAGGVVIGHPFDTVKVRMQTRVSVPTATDNAGVSVELKPAAAVSTKNETLANDKIRSTNPGTSSKNHHQTYNATIRGLIEKAVAPASGSFETLSPLGLNHNGLGFGYNGHGRVAAYPSAAGSSVSTTTSAALLKAALNSHHPGTSSSVYIAPHNHDRRLPAATLAFSSDMSVSSSVTRAGAFIDSAKQFVKSGLENAATTAAAASRASVVAAEAAAIDYDPMPWSSRTGIVDVTKSDGMFSILEKMVRDEGARSMYRGMSFPLLSAGIINAVFFGTYQASSRIIDKVYPFRVLDRNSDASSWRRRYATMFAAGAIGGATQLSIAVPVEVIKIRLQVRTGRPKLTESFHMCREIVRQNGVRGLYRGLGVQAMRDIPACACYMLLYESLLDFFHYMRDRQGVREQTSSILLAGGLSGMISWQIVIPFDVIKSRMQAGDLHLTTTKSVVPVFNGSTLPSTTSTTGVAAAGRGKLSDWLKSFGLINAWREVVREEGWRGLTRGMLPVSFRALPTNAAIFYLYETSFAYLDKLGSARKANE